MCAGKKCLRERERRRGEKREGRKSARVASNQCLPLFNLWHVVLPPFSLSPKLFLSFVYLSTLEGTGLSKRDKEGKLERGRWQESAA